MDNCTHGLVSVSGINHPVYPHAYTDAMGHVFGYSRCTPEVPEWQRDEMRAMRRERVCDGAATRKCARIKTRA